MGRPTSDEHPIDELPALTSRQIDALTEIYRYWEKHRHAPTQRELSAALGAKGSTAAPWVNVLEDKGYVLRSPPRGRRNIRLTRRGVEKLQLEGRIGQNETLFDD